METLRLRRRFRTIRRVLAELLERDLFIVCEPTARAELLEYAAMLQDDLADLHPRLFGPVAVTGEYGRSVASALRSSAEILCFVAATECAASGSAPCPFPRHPIPWAELPSGERHGWQALAATPDRLERALLLALLRPFVASRVGAYPARLLTQIGDAELHLAISNQTTDREAGHHPVAPKNATGRTDR